MKLLFLSIFILLSSCSCAYSQTTDSNPPKVEILQSTADSCADCFARSKAKDALIQSLEAELSTNKDLRAKEENYNAELLRAVALLTSSEKRNKSFFEKLRAQMGKVLMSATDPRTITTIVSIILILDKIK